MALLKMVFTYPSTDTFYQEVIDGQITRRFEMNGTPLDLPVPCSYTLADETPPLPDWYQAPA